MKKLMYRRRNNAKNGVVDKEASPDGEAIHTSPLGPTLDQEPEPAALQIWDNMFEGDKIDLPKMDFILGLSNFLSEEQMIRMGEEVENSLKTKRQVL